MTGGGEVRYDELWYELTQPADEAGLQAAESLWTWRDVDAELAALTHESVVDAELAGVRSGGSASTFTFEIGDVSIEIEINEDTRQLIGQVVPAMSAVITLERPNEESIDRAADAGGVFRISVGRRRPGRLYARLEDGRRLRTEWAIL